MRLPGRRTVRRGRWRSDTEMVPASTTPRRGSRRASEHSSGRTRHTHAVTERSWRLALVRPPGPRLAEGIVTHIARTPVDVDLARHQHAAYVAALAGAGWDIVAVPPADECPDAVFVE